MLKPSHGILAFAMVGLLTGCPVNKTTLIVGTASFGNETGGGWFERFKGLPPGDSKGWDRVSEFDLYSDSGGGARPVLCNFDDDGRNEVAIGLDSLPGNGGWVQILDDESTGFAHLAWVRYRTNTIYDSNNGETRPACGDVDGDGRDELVVGGGPGSSTLLQIFDDATTDFAHLDYQLLLTDIGYLVTNGETRPVLCDVDGDNRDEIVMGLGSFHSGKGGRVAIFDDALREYRLLTELQTTWGAARTKGTGTRPACGDLDGDGLDEIVMGFGPGTKGWLEIFDDAVAVHAPIGWTRVSWTDYNDAQGETFPACGDIDNDGVAELVIGLGAYPENGGWFETQDGFDRSDPVQLLDNRDWGRLDWEEYNEFSGATFPTVGR